MDEQERAQMKNKCCDKQGEIEIILRLFGCKRNEFIFDSNSNKPAFKHAQLTSHRTSRERA